METREENRKPSLFIKATTFIFDFIVVSILLSFSCLTLLPLVFVFGGVVHFYSIPYVDRRLKNIFVYIKNNWKILLKLEILMLVMWIFPVLTLYVLKTSIPGYAVMMFLSYMVLFLSLIPFANGPVLIDKMNLNLKQLAINSYLMIMGSPFYSLISIASVTLVIFLAVQINVFLIFLLPFSSLIVSFFSYQALEKIKNKRGKKI